MVPVDYSYQSKKKYQEPFCFTCPSNSFTSFLLPTSNLVHRSPNLSTWSSRFPSHDLYLCCWSLASRAKHSFYFGPLKTNGSNSKLSLLCLHNPPKNGKELGKYKHHCFILSVLRCFHSTGYLPHIIEHERMYLLSINTKEGGIQNKKYVTSCVLLLCTYS